MADRYTGRHIRQARHGAWLHKKRSRVASTRHTLPAAAALTVAGILIGGAGTVIQLGASDAETGTDFASGYDPADFPPPDRTAQADRASRDATRPAGANPQGLPAGNAAAIPTGTCEASYFSASRPTASGELADPATLTAAHQNLPFGSQVRVTNVATGASVVVRINDRGPTVGERCLDLSQAAFAAIAELDAGIVDVRYEILVEDAT